MRTQEKLRLSEHKPEARLCPCCGDPRAELQREMSGTEIMECPGCGSAFSGQVPSAEDVSRIYDKLYRQNGVYQQERAEVVRITDALAKARTIKLGWEHKRFFGKCSPSPGDKLLDVGCGTGLFLLAASQAGWSVRGVEVSREAAELGRAVHHFPIHVGRFEDASLTHEDFAAVTAWEVLEHLPEPANFLSHVLRLLVPGSVFAGSVPNYARRRYRYGENLGPASIPPVHLNFWAPSALKYTLQHVGFCDVEVHFPRVSIDLLRPLRTCWRPQKLIRFSKAILGLNILSSMFFIARRPN